jgi:FMN phosphatase YigB (HAD superfamily)
MTSRPAVLITDLDNTLYDWVTYFAVSFEAMLSPLTHLLGVSKEQLIQEFKELHQHYGTSEQPFIALELPSVRAHFQGLGRAALLQKLDEPLHAFNRARKETLRLYPGVAETLAALVASGVTVVGHTEAPTVNAYYRVQLLGIDRYFRRLYVRSSAWEGHPIPEREVALHPPSDLVREVPKSERKPNPTLLQDICEREGFSTGDAWYVGDSLVRDISMAKMAGVRAIWARYGTDYDPRMWSLLVRITHWTDEDVSREEELRNRFDRVKPDYVLDSFSELLDIINTSDDMSLGRIDRRRTTRG